MAEQGVLGQWYRQAVREAELQELGLEVGVGGRAVGLRVGAKRGDAMVMRIAGDDGRQFTAGEAQAAAA
jgi:hypothetical protein